MRRMRSYFKRSIREQGKRSVMLKSLIRRSLIRLSKQQNRLCQLVSNPAAERGAILRRAGEILRERNQELAELETLDTGKR